MKVLGIQLQAPSTPGLFRLLGFALGLLIMALIVEPAFLSDPSSSENAQGLIVGSFTGYLLSECGVSFGKDGWRAFALFVPCSLLIFGALLLSA